MLKLDFGCGQKKKEGFIGVDYNKETQAEIIFDCEGKDLPFNDNTIDEVYSSHFLEHLKDPVKFLQELYRVMKPGANAMFAVPNHQYSNSWFIGHYWQPAMPYLQQLVERRGFEVIKVEYDPHPDILNPANPFHEMWKKNPEFTGKHLWNAIWQIRIEFKKPDNK